MKKVSEQIADWLAEQGIQQIFSVTGGGAMFLNIALGTHPNMRCTFMHHEQACAMAAEGYARVTNKPAVVMVTTGPGAINAMNGVFGAYTDSIPMIVLSGQVKSDTCLDFHDLPNLRQLGDQEGPTIALAEHITKYSKLIKNVREIETVLPRAYLEATIGRPGPVWIDIPLDIQNSTEQLSFEKIKMSLDFPDITEQCLHILEKLKQSHRPLVLAGTGVRLSGAKEKLLRFINKAKIPLATAWTHDLINSDHPLFAGRPGSIGTRSGNFCLQNADLIIVIGSRLNIRQTGYNFDGFAKDAYLIQVDIDIEELRKPTVKPDYSVNADAGSFLDTLYSLVDKDALPRYDRWIEWCQSINKKYSVISEHSQPKNGFLNPYLVVKHIFDISKDDDVFVCGNASACIIPWQVGSIKGNQRLFSNSGSASMGYDLPTAIGAGVTGKRVICFAGDGSIQMNIQELQTLKSLDLDVVVIVINNNGYLSIRQTHENFFGKIVGATPDSGVSFPNFMKVARAFGIHSYTISSEKELEIVEKLMSLKGPLLLNVIVDPAQNFSPRMKARLDENGKFIPQFLDDMFPFLDVSEIDQVRNSAKEI